MATFSTTKNRLTYRSNAFKPLTPADVADICAVCTTQVELWWMLEPYVMAHLWDVDAVLELWYDVRMSIVGAQQDDANDDDSQGQECVAEVAGAGEVVGVGTEAVMRAGVRTVVEASPTTRAVITKSGKSWAVKLGRKVLRGLMRGVMR